MLKATDLRERSEADLRELEKTLAHDVFQNRFKNFTNRLDDTSSIRKSKKDLARVKTVLAEIAAKASGVAAAEATEAKGETPAEKPAKKATKVSASPKKSAKAESADAPKAKKTSTKKAPKSESEAK